MIQTGPVSQVWVGSVAMLQKVYTLPTCSGRPASFEDPFGNFLFLTKDPEDAKPIKEKQKAWLEANIDSEAIAAAVEEALEAQVWPVLDAGGLQEFPSDALRVATYSAITRAILGEAALVDDAELERLMAATRAYSEMRAGSKFGKKSDDAPGLPPGAAEIREIVEAALQRSGRTDADVALPLMVAASVGGAEIFPTLLHWMFLLFAQSPAREELAAAAAINGDQVLLLREIYSALRRSTYSVALGPPRKVLADATVDGMCIPEGAMLFAMHPALVDKALGVSEAEKEDFSTYAFGVGPRSCLGQQLTEALLPPVVGALLRRYRVSVPASGPAADAIAAAMEGEMRGQLIRPVGSPKLYWERRAE